MPVPTIADLKIQADGTEQEQTEYLESLHIAQMNLEQIDLLLFRITRVKDCNFKNFALSVAHRRYDRAIK
jgi:hypothetical protein